MIEYPLKYTLKHPVIWGQNQIAEINYRRPKTKDIKSLDPQNLKVDSLTTLFANVCDQAPPVIDELDIEDTFEIINIVSGFLGNGQKVGE